MMSTADLGSAPYDCELAGVVVRLGVPGRLRDRIVDLYGHAEVHAARAASLEVTVQEGTTAPSRPADASLRLAGPLEIWGDEQPGRLVLSNGEASATVRYEEGTATIAIHVDRESATHVALHQLLPIAIAELLRTKGVYAVHAACIVRDGHALLLLGDSGAGKSTLAWRAVTLGYRLLADDGVLLRSDGDTVRASPFYREFSVDPELADPALVRRSVKTWKGDRAKLDLPPTLCAESADVVAVTLLNRHATACTVQGCSKTDVLAELVHQSPFLFVQAAMAASHTAILRTLTQSCATTRLEMTPQVLTDNRLTGALLAEAFGFTGDERGAARA